MKTISKIIGSGVVAKTDYNTNYNAVHLNMNPEDDFLYLDSSKQQDTLRFPKTLIVYLKDTIYGNGNNNKISTGDTVYFSCDVDQYEIDSKGNIYTDYYATLIEPRFAFKIPKEWKEILGDEGSNKILGVPYTSWAE